MKRKIAKRALGVAMTSAMVVTSMGNMPGLFWQGSTTAEASDGPTIYVDDMNYYNTAYDEKNAYDGTDLWCTYTLYVKAKDSNITIMKKKTFKIK